MAKQRSITGFSWTKESFLIFCLKTSFALIVGLCLIDFFVYFGAVQKHLWLSPLQYLLIVGLGHAFVRWKYRVTLTQEFVKTVLLIVTPLVAVIYAAAFLIEEGGAQYPNYFFQNFGVQYSALPTLIFGLFMFGVLHATVAFYTKFGKVFYFVTTFTLIIAAGMLNMVEPDLHKLIIKEDGWVETLTALGFILAGIITLRIPQYSRLFTSTKTQGQIFKAFCILLALAFFVVAGEEISWGQRIFDVSTPEAIQDQNRQGEINLHNLETFWPYVYQAYLLIGLYGTLAGFCRWLVQDLLPNNQYLKNWLKLLAPDFYLFLNFFLIVVYVWLRERHGPWKFVMWEEISELLLIVGIVTHLIQRINQFKSKDGHE